MTPITYTSEQDIDYSKAIGKAVTLAGLRQTIDRWREIAPDAALIVDGMTETDFIEFKAGMVKERKGEFAGEAFAEKYASVLMPKILFLVSTVAMQFKVPWGLAYIRLNETGQLQKLLSQ